MALSAAFVRTAKESGRYFDGQATGLHLLVKKNGTKFWVQRITIHSKRRDLGLGSPPTVSLAEAREQALENKRIVRAGGDPLRAKREASRIVSFEEATRRAHAELAPTWKSPKEAPAFLNSMEKWVFPSFGQMPVDKVGSADVRRVILLAREKVPHVAAKLTYRISAVFAWAMAEQMREDNPASGSALNLPKQRAKVAHYRALPYGEVSSCVAAVHASNAWLGTKLCFEFLVLTAVRSGEARGARWSEIDGDTWTIPAERMKMAREHAVPLSARAMEILEGAKKLRDDSGLIFPSVRGKVLSDMTLSKLVRELGFPTTVHGLRSSFRVWSQEQTGTPREVAEAALAHVTGGKIERSYARSDLFQKRRVLMNAWTDYLSPKPAKVVSIHG